MRALQRAAPPLNPTCRLLLDLVQASPGLNIQEIATFLAIQRTSAKHHARRLLKDGQIVVRRQGHHLLHFPARLGPLQILVLSTLRIPSVRDVADLLFHQPHLSRQEMADLLDTTPRTVGRAVRALRRQGLLVVQRGSPAVRTAHLHPALRVALTRGPPGRSAGSAGPPPGDSGAPGTGDGGPSGVDTP